MGEELKKKMKKTDQEGGNFINLTFTLLGATKEEFLLTISEYTYCKKVMKRKISIKQEILCDSTKKFFKLKLQEK